MPRPIAPHSTTYHNPIHHIPAHRTPTPYKPTHPTQPAAFTKVANTNNNNKDNNNSLIHPTTNLMEATTASTNLVGPKGFEVCPIFLG